MIFRKIHNLLLNFKTAKLLNIKVPFGKFGDVKYYAVKTEVATRNMDFDLRKDAEAYRKILKKSRAPIASTIERMELDGETGLLVIYPPKDK